LVDLGRPSFEILGSSVEIAQQLENNCLPMKVQISQAVFELISRSQFHFTKRKVIDRHDVQTITYFASRLSRFPKSVAKFT
jgi:class 3 adenylate cyclase